MALIPRCVVLTILVASIYLVNSKAINDLLTEDSMMRYFSVSTIEEVPEYEIINPVSNGRRRRSIDGSEYPDQHEVKFTAFGEDYHMKLRKNTELIRPGSMAEYVHENGTVTRKPIVNHCYYIGELASHDKSRAAVSTCRGVSGIFSHGNNDVYIQPLQEDHAEKVRRSRSDLEHPHVIFRRSVGDLPNKETDETREMKEHVCGNDARYYHDANNNNEMANPPPVDKEPKEETRTKRQTSSQVRYLELLVVADLQMLQYHGNDVEDYTLTLMNIAAGRYIDPSLGTIVKLYITKLLILQSNYVTMQAPNGRTASFSVLADAGITLPNFCNFQSAINPSSDSDPNHWDNAVLISRYNLNLYGNGNLLGLARLWSTCSSTLQCSMNEESGLAAGLTITHEIGHTLGISHDDGNQCRDNVNIMASSRTAGADSYIWSTCSRNYLNAFFSSRSSDCTKDVPSSYLPNVIETVTDDLPGRTYDADAQCALVFGQSYSACSYNPYPANDDCSYLWCQQSTTTSGCRGTGSARMDGTFCGANRICMQGVCVYSIDEAPEPINGGWSAYDANFGSCSRTCGGGVQFRYRYCNNPTPANGGAECVGDNSQFRMCNQQPCRKTQEDFRNEQCASTNNRPFNNQYLQWTGYTTGLQGDDLCAFKCLSNTNTVTTRGDYFADGTRCDVAQPNSGNVCVKGKCMKFGCDGVPNSSAEYDKCGECGGTGSSCTRYAGSVFEMPPVSTYSKILTIAAGATSVEIFNYNTQSHMAVKINGQYVIGGQSSYAPTAMEYKYNDDSLYYYKTPSEMINIPRRTANNVDIEVYMYVPYTTYVSWVYYLPNGVTPVEPEPEVPTYQWFTKNEYTECSTTCGQGTQFKVVACLRSDDVEVHASYCSDQTTPTRETRTCQLDECSTPAPTYTGMYIPGPWEQCSVTCGAGVQTRKIYCVRRTANSYTITDDTNCDPSERPTEEKTCVQGACSQGGVWVIGQWTSCSASCGGGVRSRTVICKRAIDSNVYLVESECPSNKPSTQEPCNAAACPPPPPINPSGVCNVVLTDPSRGILVGNTNGEYCNTTIVAPVNQRIVVTFVSVNVDCRTGGNFIIKDGSSAYTICSSLTNRAWPRSRTNVMEIAGVTTQNNQGYEITFTFETVSYQNDDCDSVQTSDTGTVSSPNYPFTYTANTDCYNYIVAPPGKRVSVSFTAFDIEYHPRCGYDSVRIKDLESYYTIYYCSSRQPFTWVSMTNKVQVQFHSDPGLEKTGFYATYTFV